MYVFSSQDLGSFYCLWLLTINRPRRGWSDDVPWSPATIRKSHPIWAPMKSAEKLDDMNDLDVMVVDFAPRGDWCVWDFKESFIDCGYFMLFPNKRGGAGLVEGYHSTRRFGLYFKHMTCWPLVVISPDVVAEDGWNAALERYLEVYIKKRSRYWNIQDGSHLLRLSLRMSSQRLLRFVGTLVVLSMFIP